MTWNRFAKLAAAAVALVAVGHAAETEEVDETDVHVLTEGNFDKFLEDNPLALVEFYAPWCGHCNRLKPEYAKAATTLKKAGGVPLAKVDATAEPALGTRFEVRGYPTLKFFRNGQAEEYSGGRTADTIVQWIESATGPAIEFLDSLPEEAPEKGVLFAASVKSKDSAAAKLLAKVAEARRMTVKFVAAVDAKADETLRALRSGEDAVQAPLNGTEEEVGNWVDEEKFPFFGPIDGENYAAYHARQQEVVWFAGKEDDYKKAADAIRAAAKEFRSDYSFVWIDTERFPSHAESGLGLSKTPGLVLRLEAGGRYVFPDEKGFVTKEIVSFFKKVKDGEIEKFLKSDPIPEDNDEPVKVVVGKNFEDMVFRADKDVMLEVYAPWCGHCKRLEPTYVQLAEMLEEKAKHVVIAKMDGTTNEPPNADFSFRGFPTIFWVKAGEKTPVTYNEARNLEDLLKFIKTNSSKPVDVDMPTEDDKDEKEEEEPAKDEL